MFVLSDILTYIRRIIKTPSDAAITDELLIDYVNRFWINDVDARIQLFDLKTKYQFLTTPGVDKYNMPLYNYQVENPSTLNSTIGLYPVYQGFMSPAYINGIDVALQTQKNAFYNIWPNIVQNLAAVAIGNGNSAYTIQLPILSMVAPPNPPINAILRGHVDINGIIALATAENDTYQDPPVTSTFLTSIPVTSVEARVFISSLASDGSNILVTDSGQFLQGNQNYGLLMQPGSAPFGNQALPGGYGSSYVITGITNASLAVITVNNDLLSGETVIITGVTGMTQINGTFTIVSATATTITINVNSTSFGAYVSGGTVSSLNNVINYVTGTINVTFPEPIPAGNNINVQCFFFQSGLPRAMLFYNNTLILRNVPSSQYLVEVDCYYTPAAFLNSSQAVPYGYMSEYIARGAARKILSDTGDQEQLQFYEPMFREQEMLVWKRSQRQFTATRTETIYSQGLDHGLMGNTNSTGGTI